MTYTMVGPPNTINGRQVFRALGTHINWDAIGADPNVILENCRRVRGRFVPHDGSLSKDPVAVVGYGASLQDTWETVLGFQTIFTCSGSHKFLLSRGIIPTHHIDSDPRPHKVRMLGIPQPEVTYLPASICHPTYFDLLERYEIPRVLLWHLLFFEREIYSLIPQGEVMLTGGNTVGPRAIKMARLMGYTNLHLFGFDANEGYADLHFNAPKSLAAHEYKGRTYFTTYNWLEHAKIMFEDLDRMPEVKVTFYGEGLIQEMAKDYVRTPRAETPLAVIKT